MARSMSLPGLADKRVDEIEEAADTFEAASERLEKARDAKALANDQIIKVLTKHKLKAYRYGTLVVTVADKKVVQVKRSEAAGTK